MTTCIAEAAATVPADQHVDTAAILARLAPWLDDLAARIDPGEEERLLADWIRYARGAWPEPVFTPRPRTARPPRIPWPAVHINDAVLDPALMVLHQLRGCSDQLERGGGSLLCVRCNYGTPTLATVFGVEARLSDRHMDTLPGSLPLGTAAVQALSRNGAPPAATSGLMPLVLAVGRAFRTVLGSRPALRHVHLYHPDFQGPLDVLELVWGSDCFVQFIDEPELAADALDAITTAYLDAWRAWCGVQPPRGDGLAVHWGILHRGQVMLRDDSAMNLSPAMARRLVAPYDGRILAEAGGGAIHACGKVDHWLPTVSRLPGLHMVNLGQAEMNDPARIWAETVQRGIQLTPMPAAQVERARSAGLDPGGQVAVPG
jgi:hypothetical protein